MPGGVTESDLCHHDVVSEVDQEVQRPSPSLASGVDAPLGDAEPIDLRESGCETDFASFYRSHRGEIGRALAYTLGSVSLAEEAVDEAMMRAYQRWSEVSQYDNPGGWVYRAGVNWGKSWKRSAFRRSRREEKAASRTEPLRDVDGEPESPAEELFRALESLPLNQRSVVVLRHYCDWSVSATAEALGVSEGTIKSRSARGLAQLRRVLDGEVGNG